jgi:hypothetical protein
MTLQKVASFYIDTSAEWKRMSPHCHRDDKSVQYSFSSVVARILLIEQIAAKLPAMSRDLSGAASYVYQNPKHMPDTECHFDKTVTKYIRMSVENKA